MTFALQGQIDELETFLVQKGKERNQTHRNYIERDV
jgi:hypothetical protein